MKNKVLIIVSIVGVLLICFGFGITIFKPVNESSKIKNEEKNNLNDKKLNMSPPNNNNYKTNDDGSMVNISEKITDNHVNGEFVIKDMNISLKSMDDFLASYSFTIINTGANNYDSLNVSIVFIFADGSKLDSSSDKITISAGDSITVERKDYFSILGAVDYEVVVEPSTN